MLKFNVQKFMEVMAGAEVYEMPEMNEGTRYLYEHLYKPMANKQEVRISDLDFDAFMLEDLQAFEGIYSTFICEQASHTNIILKTLSEISPKASKISFI